MRGFLRKKGKARRCLIVTVALLLVISMLPIGPMAAAIDIPDAPMSDFQTAPAATGLVSNLTGWPEATGTWSITEDGLVGQNLALADQFFLSGTQVTGDDSFSYEGDITLPAGEGQNAAGLVVWSSSGWYCVNVDRAGGVARLFKVGEGAWAAPDRALTNQQKEQSTFHLRMEVSNHQVRYYLDGTLVASYTDPNLSGGQLGVVGHFSNATFQSLNKGELTSGFDSNLTGWPEATGTWSITDEGLIGQNAGLMNQFFLSGTSVSPDDSFTYDGDITLPIGEGQNAAGLVVWSDTGWYCVNVDRAGGVAKLFKNGNGGWAIDNYTLTEAQKSQETFHLQMSVTDGLIQYYLDGVMILSYKDENFSGGQLGVVGHLANATFNHLLYTSTNVPKLTGIEVEGFTFTEPFESGRTRYLTNVPASTESIRIKATADAGLELSVDGKSVQNGIFSEPIALHNGMNRITVGVTNPELGYTTSITVSVYRLVDRETGYQEDYRPQFHFSNYQGFMNDPNGLLYNADTGEYHLYFQIDPDADSLTNWPSNLQREWGHAVSTDLVNWVDCGIVMEPDDLGEIYSGCGIVDRENTSGLFDESVPPDSRLVYIYTNTNGFGQSLAYSLDGGYTLIKYENNPVIPNPGGIYGGGMRDPKVIRYDGKWILTVGGIGNQQTSIFASDDLIHWEYQSQMFHKDGSVVDADCTDLYPMTVEGTGETKWVYNGAGTFYVIGDLVKNSQGKYEFVAETAPIPYTACSDVYATQTFFNDAKGRRVAMSWLQDDPGATRIWAGQQTLPWEIGLKKSGDSYLLTSYPVEEFEAYRSDSPIFSTTDTTVKEDSANILAGIAGQKYDIEAIIDPGNAEEFGFRLRQGNGRELVVKYDAVEQKMILDRSKTNEGLGRTGIHSFDLKKNPDGTINMRIIVDTSTIEAFGNQGEAVFAGIYYTEAENIGMEFYTVGDDVTVKEMNIYDVRSMYRDDQSQPTDKPTLLSLSTSPAQVEPGKEFTVYANVLPYNVADKSVAWSYDEALTLVRQDANSITLVAKEEGDYTVGAVTTLGSLEKSITISVKESLEHLFKTNLTDWQTSAGTWTYEEGGYTGVCPSGDNAAVAKQKISGDFSLEADVTLNNNHGFAALGLVMYAQDVNAAAAGAYIFNYDIGMQAFRFFRFPYRDIATVSFADAGITMEMGKTYHVKIDCKDNKFTISVEDIEIFKDLTDPDGPTYQSGRMGVLGTGQTYRCKTIM